MQSCPAAPSLSITPLLIYSRALPRSSPYVPTHYYDKWHASSPIPPFNYYHHHCYSRVDRMPRQLRVPHHLQRCTRGHKLQVCILQCLGELHLIQLVLQIAAL